MAQAQAYLLVVCWRPAVKNSKEMGWRGEGGYIVLTSSAS